MAQSGHPGHSKSSSRTGRMVRTFSASQRDLTMLESIARYHGFSKSATVTSLVRKEFWRIFPKGTEEIQPEPGARILGEEGEHDHGT